MRPALLALVLAVALVPTAARGDLLYGLTATGPGPGPANAARLIQIDSATGAGTLIGFTGFDGGEALDIAPNGDLLAIGWDGQTPLRFNDLFVLNPTTGAATLVGSGDPFIAIEGLTVGPTGTLFGTADDDFDPFGDESKYLVTIDRATGAATRIGAFGPAFVSVEALAFSPLGVLYGANIGTDTTSPSLITIDPATGAATLVATLPANQLIYGMDFAPDGTLYVTTHTTRFGGPARLGRIDNLATGAIIDIGPIGFDTVQGLAFASPIPEPGTLALLAVGGVALAAYARRREQSSGSVRGMP